MAHKDEHLARLEAQIEEWSKRIDKLMAKAQSLKDDARSTALKQIDEGREKLAAARKMVAEAKTMGAERYEEAKANLEHLWRDAKALLEKGASHER